MAFSRRTFLKLGIAGGGGVAFAAASRLTPGGPDTLDQLDERNLHRDLPETWVRSFCDGCPTACAVVLRRVGGRVVGVRPLNPKPCARAYVIPQEIVHPDRIPPPARRDEAVAAVREALMDHPERCALLVREDTGLSFALLKAAFAVAGCRHVATVEHPLLQLPVDGLEEATGRRAWRYDLSHSDGVVSFGWDWMQAYPSPPEAQEAWRRMREAGLPMIHIGPRLCLTAMRSREWIACRPGTEHLAALHLLRLLAREGVVDPGDAERDTGVSASAFARVAQAFGDRKPLCLGGRGRLEEQRPVVALNGLLDHFNRPGGILPLHEISLPVPIEEVPAESLAAGIEGGAIDTIVLAGANPVFDGPSPSRWRAALGKARRVICLSSFSDETTALADLVIPLALAAERGELHMDLLDGAPVRRVTEAAVASSAIAPEEVAFHLATLPWKTLQEAADALVVRPPEPASFRLPPLEAAPVEPGDGLRLLLEVPQVLARGGGARHPYLLTSVGPHLREWWTTWAEIHPRTAQRHGIRDRDWIVVESDAGAVRAMARTYEGISPEAVCLPLGLGHATGVHAQADGGNPMELVSNGRTPVHVRIRRV